MNGEMSLNVTVTCAPDQFACTDSTCISTNMLCDGATDCPGGEDEARAKCTTISLTPSPSVTPAVQTPGISG